jgi:hypothetical protein
MKPILSERLTFKGQGKHLHPFLNFKIIIFLQPLEKNLKDP